MANLKSISLWLSGEQDCAYLDDRRARSAFVHPDTELDPAVYSRLIELGFRRSGDHVYRPHCDHCQACIPTRVPVREFQPNRKQRRCLTRNASTRTVIRGAEFDPRHFRLYQTYLRARHDKPDEAPPSEEDYLRFLGSRWCDTHFVEFLIEGRLAAVAVVDVIDHGLSAVYTFFDPALAAYSPGVYAVLWQIEYAKQLELPYVYLGFWIAECRKMRYKIDYQPLSGLIAGQWQSLLPPSIHEE